MHLLMDEMLMLVTALDVNINGILLSYNVSTTELASMVIRLTCVAQLKENSSYMKSLTTRAVDYQDFWKSPSAI